MSKLERNIAIIFEKSRLVFWYDTHGSFESLFKNISINGVDKHVISDNELAIKYDVIVNNSSRKFLIYKCGDRPDNEDNWLLDLELSNQIFESDQIGLVLQELGLSYSLRGWLEQHIAFFQNNKRLLNFSHYVNANISEDELSNVLLKLIINASGNTFDDIIRRAVELLVDDNWEDVFEQLKFYDIDSFFWKTLESKFNYISENPSLYDFLLALFKKSFGPLSSPRSLNSGAEVLLANWKDARSFQAIFVRLSAKVEQDLSIEDKINGYQLEELLGEDLFESVEQQMIRILVSELGQHNVSWGRVTKVLKARESSYWYQLKYRDFYKVVHYGAELLQFIQVHEGFKFEDYNSGLDHYVKSGFKADQYYRLFIDHYRMTKQNNVLVDLYNTVHRAYSNTWLLYQSGLWQLVIEREGSWYSGEKSQFNFFRNWVSNEFLEKERKLFVVVSDALRFENGEDLHQRFSKEARFSSQLDYQVTGLPSYTQLGMASLLPHKELAFGVGDMILADGKSTSGSGNRRKILEEHSGVRATVIGAEELMRLKTKGQEAKDLVQGHDLIYIYHNRIDKVGDDKTSEDKVIEAAREEVDFLVNVAKKISNMNGTHVLFTSDHGYIYQHEVLDQSDFTEADIAGEIVKENRRFVIGKNLRHNHNAFKFQATELGLNSDLEVLIPKGISRLRKQGAGSRFVHGGASLQEVVVPVVWVSKKKSNTVEKVTIDVLNKSNNRITTNIHKVRFYQNEAVGNGFIPRQVKAYFGIEKQGEFMVLSDIFNYRFDNESNKSEEREVVKKFILSTDIRNSEDVYLLIEERVEGSNQWNLLHKYPYSLTLAMMNDFDDF